MLQAKIESFKRDKARDGIRFLKLRLLFITASIVSIAFHLSCRDLIRAVFKATGKKSEYKCHHQSSGTTTQTQKNTVKRMNIFGWLDHFASGTQGCKVIMQRARAKCYFIILYLYNIYFSPKTALGMPRLLGPVSKPDQQLSY